MSNLLNSNIETLFGKMEDFISTKTVVGEAIHMGDVLIVPLIEVTFGVGVGISAPTSDDEKKKRDNSVGALGGKITPSAVLVVVNGTVQLVNVKNQDSVNKLIDMVPGILSKLNFNFGKKKKAEGDVESDIKNEVKSEVGGAVSDAAESTGFDEIKF